MFMANSGHLVRVWKHNFGPLKTSFCSTLGWKSWDFAPFLLHLSELEPYFHWIHTSILSNEDPLSPHHFLHPSESSRLNLLIYGTLLGGLYSDHNLWVLFCSRDSVIYVLLYCLFYIMSCLFPIFHCCVQIDNLTYLGILSNFPFILLLLTSVFDLKLWALCIYVI